MISKLEINFPVLLHRKNQAVKTSVFIDGK